MYWEDHGFEPMVVRANGKAYWLIYTGPLQWAIVVYTPADAPQGYQMAGGSFEKLQAWAQRMTASGHGDIVEQLDIPVEGDIVDCLQVIRPTLRRVGGGRGFADFEHQPIPSRADSAQQGVFKYEIWGEIDGNGDVALWGRYEIPELDYWHTGVLAVELRTAEDAAIAMVRIHSGVTVNTPVLHELFGSVV